MATKRYIYDIWHNYVTEWQFITSLCAGIDSYYIYCWQNIKNVNVKSLLRRDKHQNKDLFESKPKASFWNVVAHIPIHCSFSAYCFVILYWINICKVNLFWFNVYSWTFLIRNENYFRRLLGMNWIKFLVIQ